jgi:zinc finger protein 423
VIQQRDNSQMNAVNKINNLPSVSVSSQPSRIIRQTIYSPSQATHKCFICDENILGQATTLTDCETITSREKVTKKLAKMVGDDFCVIVSEDDAICRRCLTLFNTMDKYEFDLENVRSRLRSFINKKYSIDEQEEPPAKLQKLNSGSPRWNAPKETAETQLKTLSSPVNAALKRAPVKLYKCIACDFKTTDLNAFQPHSNVCKGQVNKSATPPQQNRVVRQTYQPPQKPPTVFNKTSPQKVGGTTIVRNTPPQPQLQCRTCSFKTADRVLFQEHQRNHMKLRPFKCRMCLERFETREAAQTHAKIHSQPPGGGWKCGICSRHFQKRDMFDAHMKTHERFKSVVQPEVHIMKDKHQKPLTDIIKEALSEDDQDAVNELIEFHSCNLCSLTFVNKKLYAQHMKTHENPTEKLSESPVKQQDTLGDLESIFEKMHSEGHHTGTSNGDKNVLITTQEGGITYNITIPQDDDEEEVEKDVRISMPNLDDVGEPKDVVSMPSLHDEEEENTQSSQEVPMDLEDPTGGDGQQLKFIVDENGQFLQLDNHILTTDAEGNQILVQGTDQEQLQHLLQSVGVDGGQMLVQLQGNGEEMDGEGTTLQMIAGDGNQGQMILVQGADGEQQLIDASMLQTEDGNLVLRQGEDGQTHLTTADGTPVSVSFSGEGGEGHITMTMASGHEEGQQIFMEQQMEQEQQVEEGQEQFSVQEEAQEVAEEQQNVSETAENVTSTTEEVKEESETSEVVEAPLPVLSEEEKVVEEDNAVAEAESKPEEATTEEKVRRIKAF